MVDLTEAGLLQQDYEEPVGKDRVDSHGCLEWVLKHNSRDGLEASE